MNRLSRSLPTVAVPAALLLALGGCGGGYGGDDGASPAGQITSIDITPVDATVTSDGTQQFTAVASNASGDTVSAGSLDWRSSNTGVAMVDADGLATAVAAGTTTITARKDTSDIYGGGGIVVSNEAELTVTSSTGVTGIAAGPAPMGKALVVLRDQAGNSQTVLTDAGGRFSTSVAGMAPPFLLRASDQQGRNLFSAGVQAGVVNINPLTDLLVRAWFRARGMNADVAFAGHQAPGGPDAPALESLNGALAGAFRDTISEQGLALKEFSIFTTPYAADGSGIDRVVAELRTSVGTSQMGTSQMAIHDGLSGRHAEVIFTSPDQALLRIRPGIGNVTALPLLPDER